MSHSKMTKRGRSHYVETWNPKAKNYIVSCFYCGKTGFKPSILEHEFAKNLEKKAIVNELQKTLSPLVLDNEGRCDICSKIEENKLKG